MPAAGYPPGTVIEMACHHDVEAVPLRVTVQQAGDEGNSHGVTLVVSQAQNDWLSPTAEQVADAVAPPWLRGGAAGLGLVAGHDRLELVPGGGAASARVATQPWKVYVTVPAAEAGGLPHADAWEEGWWRWELAPGGRPALVPVHRDTHARWVTSDEAGASPQLPAARLVGGRLGPLVLWRLGRGDEMFARLHFAPGVFADGCVDLYRWCSARVPAWTADGIPVVGGAETPLHLVRADLAAHSTVAGMALRAGIQAQPTHLGRYLIRVRGVRALSPQDVIISALRTRTWELAALL